MLVKLMMHLRRSVLYYAGSYIYIEICGLLFFCLASTYVIPNYSMLTVIFSFIKISVNADKAIDGT